MADPNQNPDANGGGNQPDPNAGGGNQPDPNAGGGNQPDPNGGGNQPDPNAGGGNQPDPNAGGGNQPDPNAGGGNQPDPNGGGNQPDPNAPPPLAERLGESWRDDAVSHITDPDKRERALRELARSPDIHTLVDRLVDAQDHIRSGRQASEAPPENASDEEMAAWREQRGVPENANSYDFTLPDGVVLGEDDENILDVVKEEAFAQNIPNEQLDGLVGKFFQARNEEVVARQAKDIEEAASTDRVLSQMWGADVDANKNLIRGLLAKSMPEEVANKLRNARMDDGTALFNSPEFLGAMAKWARELDPAGAMVPTAQNATSAVEQIIADGKKAMEASPNGRIEDPALRKKYMQALETRRTLYDRGEWHGDPPANVGGSPKPQG